MFFLNDCNNAEFMRRYEQLRRGINVTAGNENIRNHRFGLNRLYEVGNDIQRRRENNLSWQRTNIMQTSYRRPRKNDVIEPHRRNNNFIRKKTGVARNYTEDLRTLTGGVGNSVASQNDPLTARNKILTNNKPKALKLYEYRMSKQGHNFRSSFGDQFSDIVSRNPRQTQTTITPASTPPRTNNIPNNTFNRSRPTVTSASTTRTSRPSNRINNARPTITTPTPVKLPPKNAGINRYALGAGLLSVGAIAGGYAGYRAWQNRNNNNKNKRR